MSGCVSINPQDLVTDSESSSSENESLSSSNTSSSDDDAQRGFGGQPEPVYSSMWPKETRVSSFSDPRSRQHPIPRKVERLRDAVFDSLLYAFDILNKRETQAAAVSTGSPAHQWDSVASRPVPTRSGRVPNFWQPLVQRLSQISPGLGALHDDLPQPIPKVLALLIVILDEDLVALPADKAYLRRDLNKLEAGAARTFARRWTGWRAEIVSHFTLVESLEPPTAKPFLDLQAAKAIQHMPRPFLIRVAHCALQVPHSRRLSLSKLQAIPLETWEATDFGCLTVTLGLDAFSIDNLALAGNGFKRLPDWKPWPFPALETLDLTSNPLEAVPFRLLTIRSLREVFCDEIRDAAAVKSKRVIGHAGLYWLQGVKRQQPAYRSLVEYCIAILLRYQVSSDELDGLPPVLRDYVRLAYNCELCQTLCVPSTTTYKSGHALWLKKEVSATWEMTSNDSRPDDYFPIEWERHVPVRGRICGPCRRGMG